MKYILVVLIIIFNDVITSAQKHALYTDLGICGAHGDPGFSATYNYNFIKWIGVGAGGQGYVYFPTITTPRRFTPAAYGELRFRIRPEKISQYFIFVDLGMNFYSHSDAYWGDGNYIYQVTKDNGTYFGLGTGYFLRMVRRGWGSYISVKIISNSYKVNTTNIITNDKTVTGNGDATIVLSLGFRFGDDSKVW